MLWSRTCVDSRSTQASACRLIYLEGRSQEEAAALLGYSKAHLSRLHRDALESAESRVRGPAVLSGPCPRRDVELTIPPREFRRARTTRPVWSQPLATRLRRPGRPPGEHAMTIEELADRADDVALLLVGQLGIHRQGERLARGRFGDGEVAGLVAERREAGLQVERDRVVDLGPDLAGRSDTRAARRGPRPARG